MLKIGYSLICCVLAAASMCQGLICYECNNARNDAECRRKGRIRLCGKNQLSCQTTERIDFAYGPIVKITKRCKQARACNTNYEQNNGYKAPQCRHFKKLSVCRCCCTDDLCNFDSRTCAGVANRKLLLEYVQNCPKLPRMKNGAKACDNKNFPGSRCYFRCNKYYDLKGPGSMQCRIDKRRAKWSDRMPCCSKPCPPHGNMDLILAVDSSVRLKEDYDNVKEFLKTIIRSFIVGPDDSRIGVIPYNDKVGIRDEIYLTSFNTTNSLAQAVNFLPHNPGSHKGTRMGQLLDHVNRVSLSTKRGNRPKVRDILLILTTGPPLKERLKPEQMSKLMRDKGIDVITVGIGRYVDIKQLRGTAGVKKRVVEIPGGIDQIGESKLREDIINLICGFSCRQDEF